MVERKGNLWHSEGIPVITTNGFVKKNGAAVMGRGCAKEATRRFPGVEFKLGKIIKEKGNRLYISPVLGFFPVKAKMVIYNGYDNVVKHMASKFKQGDKVPGWAAKADLEIIKRSATELQRVAGEHPDKVFNLPRPGCGAGELEWHDVRYIMKELPDNVICHTF